MWQLIGGIFQLLLLILKDKFERDQKVRERREAQHKEAVDAIKTGDVSRINVVLDRLRRQRTKNRTSSNKRK